MLLQDKKAPTGPPKGVVCASTTAQANAAKEVRNSCCCSLHPNHLEQQPSAALHLLKSMLSGASQQPLL